MPTYKYVAVDHEGAKVKETAEAPSEDALRHQLLLRNLDVQQLKQKKSFNELELTPQRVPKHEVMHFSRQMAAFVRTGIPIVEALEVIEDTSGNKRFSAMCSTMREQIQNGTNFSEAVAEHSRVFPPYYIAILRTAEHTGQLDLALDQLSEYLEREIASWAKIKSALTYPFVVLGMSILVMFVLALWVLPRFTKLFKELGGKLPLPTRMLMGLSTALSKFWYVEVGLIALFIAGLVWLNKSDRGKLIRDKTFLRIPLVKDVVLYSVVERVFRIVSTMVQAGVPLPDTIAAAIRGTNNKVFERALTSAQERMLEGEGLAGPVKDTGVFPRAAMQMVKVGEETGTLDTQLENAAVYYGRELEYKVQKLTTLFEPLIIIFMGVIVGFVAVALVMAMYGIFGQLNHLRGRGS